MKYLTGKYTGIKFKLNEETACSGSGLILGESYIIGKCRNLKLLEDTILYYQINNINNMGITTHRTCNILSYFIKCKIILEI